MAIQEQLRATSENQIQKGMVVGPAFVTMRDLVLRCGRSYNIQPLPAPRTQWSTISQACYANALHAAMTCKWVYVEGYAIPRRGRLAIPHAWVTDPCDPAVAHDPTWRTGREYFGIPFKLEYVLRLHERTGRPGVLDAWELGWPLLRGDDRIEEIMWKAG